MVKFFIKIKLLLFFLLLFSEVSSQSITINEQFQNKPLAEVLDLLKEKYQLTFAYDETALQDIHIDKNLHHANLSEALAQLLYDTNLTYQITGQNRILIRQKKTTNLPPAVKEYLLLGSVKDATTGKSLPYANVLCEKAGVGTTSDDLGLFKLKIKSTDTVATIKIQYLGYGDRICTLPLKNSKTPFDIGLNPEVFDFQQVTIMERLPVLSTNSYYHALSLNAASLQSLPAFAGGNDLFRNLQLLPGISAFDDLSAGLEIRGSGDEENMIVLDGMTLFNVYHFFGIFSAINPHVIGKVNVYKNTYPIEYGARTAGVIEMESNHLEHPVTKGGTELNLLTSSVWLQIPFAKNMELLVGGRITNRDLGETDLFDLATQETKTPENTENLLGRDRFISANPNFRFYDLNAKWAWRANPKTSFQANFFKGFDRNISDYDLVFTSRLTGVEVDNQELFSEASEWSNMGLSARWQQRWSKHFQSQLNFAHSMYNIVGEMEAEFRPRQAMPITINNKHTNDLQQYDLNWKHEWRPQSTQLLTFGYNLVQQSTDLALAADENTLLKAKSDALSQAVYAEFTQTFNEKTTATMGLRGTHFSGTNKFYCSPRLQLTHQVTDYLTLKTSWSLNHQFLRQPSYENRFGRTVELWVLANGKKFPVSNSKNFMAGFNFLNNHFELDVEVFHKRTNEMLEYALLIPGFGEARKDASRSDGYRLFKGNRTAFGVDLLLKKQLGNYNGWLAYTLSKTTDRFKQINFNNPYPSQNDRRHQLSFVNQYRLGQWSFSTTYVFASGRPYIDLSKLAETENSREQLKLNDVLTRLKAYHRLDLSVNYSFKIKGLDAKIGGSIFNVFNRNNVKYRQYIQNIPAAQNTQSPQNIVTGTDLQLLGITPNLSFELRF